MVTLYNNNMQPKFQNLVPVQPQAPAGSQPNFSNLQPIDPGSSDFSAASQSLSGSKAGVSHSNTLLNSIGSAVQNAPDNSAIGETKNFGEALGSNLTDMFIKPAATFVKSALSAPIDIVRGLMGKAPLNEGKLQTIQSQFSDNASKVSQGTMSPLSATATAVGQTVGGAADTLGAAEALDSKPVKAISDYVDKKIGSTTQKSAMKKALDVVTPDLTKGEKEAALAKGKGKAGGFFSKTTIAPDKKLLDTADAVNGIVKKGATGAENISNVRKALSDEAESLKTQIKSVDHPYSFKELNAKMNAVESPISIKGTAFERQIDAVKGAAMDIAKKNGGTISNLLDSRKEFDALVDKEYPNLYDKENAPMRNAITGIRNMMNDFIESNLPDNVSFKDSLNKQSLYYNAIDNIAGKTTGEIGTSKFGNFIKSAAKNPLVRYGGSAIVGGEAAKHL